MGDSVRDSGTVPSFLVFRSRRNELMGRKRSIYAWGLAFGLSAVLMTSLPGNTADLQTIRDRGFLSVAVSNHRFPLSFRDAAGNWSGFEEIGRAHV